MIADRRRALLQAAMTIASLTIAADGELLEYRAAFASVAPAGAVGTASFLSVDAIPGSTLTTPARAYAGGVFTGPFQIAQQPGTLDNQQGEDGVLSGWVHDPAADLWKLEWLAQVRSDRGDCRITDVEVSPDGQVFVTGIFQGDVIFQLRPPLNPITFNTQPGGGAEGFVAIADPSGEWINAFPVKEMQPNSIALTARGEICLAGTPHLARCYDPGGDELWTAQTPPEILEARHIVFDAANPQRNLLYVLADALVIDGQGARNREVLLAQLDAGSGAVIGFVPVEGPGEEHAGGLDVGPLSRVYLSFSTDNSREVTVGGRPLQEIPTNSGRHAHLVILSPDGDLLTDNLLGTASDQGGVMESSDLAVDPAGNAHVAVSFNGPFSFEGVPRNGQQDAAVIAIDAAGTPIRFTRSAGPAQALGLAVAAPGRNRQLLAGRLQGSAAEQFDNLQLPAAGEGNAYLAILEPTPDQQPYLLTSPAGEPLDVMAQRVHQAGGEVYRSVEFPGARLRFVSAFLTEFQLERLSQFLEATVDGPLARNGTVSPSGYALEALNKAPAVAPHTYDFPETCTPAVLYLIDTAIDNSSGYFDGNPNLTLGPTTLIREIGDPLASSEFDHGTEMLSMIAGPGVGAAQGTPITVINYDIYPNGAPARASAVAEAIALANSDKAANYPFDPAVYCVASSADSPGNSTASLKALVSYATSSAVFATVVLSAGNTAGLAEDYTPSDLGLESGVICAGAIDQTNTQVANTRGGKAVDIWAPGDSVAATNTAGLATAFTGTSASAAFTAGAALIYLSANPVATPADLETALVTTFAQSDSIGQILRVPESDAPGFATFADWGAWFGLADSSASGNDDGDSWTNHEEYVWGLDPLAVDYQGSLVDLSYERATDTMTFSFPLSCQLYQVSALTAPHTLRNGSTLSVERSSDLNTWTDVTNSLTLEEVGHSGGQVTLSFDYVLTSTRCFFRVVVQ